MNRSSDGILEHVFLMKIDQKDQKKKIQRSYFKGQIKITKNEANQMRVRETLIKVTKKSVDVFITKMLNILKKIISIKIKIKNFLYAITVKK